ncbi:MAG: sodium:proton antiporter [Bacteroidales bacterium]|nr:sodium:proton antiporter [Bacteroidales bacterium]
MTEKKVNTPNAIVSFIPILTLIITLILVVKIFNSSVMDGASQVALLISSAVCVAIGMIFYKVPWSSFEDAIKENISNVGSAIVMLLLIGAIGGTWMLSGVVPTMIYYGLQIIDPKIFLFVCCVVSAVISIVTGSSWTTIATIGVALIGIGQSQGISTSWIAGAVISGAYFGDKISPLSDTTVIASSTVGTPLFTHIRYMMITTIPSMIISLIIFLIAGFIFHNDLEQNVDSFAASLQETFNISPYLMIVPLVTLVLILFKIPSLIVLFLSAFIVALLIPITQPEIISQIVGVNEEMSLINIIKGVLISCYGSTSVETSNPMLTDLIATRGMSGMMNTIWLIICAMCFGGVMMGSGMIASITRIIMRFIKRTVTLVASTVFTGVFSNICVSDQYLSIILTCNIFKDYYDKNGYEPRLLSRSAEDSATVTSPLIPWNTCAMTHATMLGVATLSYLPYCFFNILSPLMSIIVAAIGYKIFKKKVDYDFDSDSDGGSHTSV